MSAERAPGKTLGRDVDELRAELAELDLLGVAEVIATAHHVTVDELLGVSRCRPLPSARRLLWLELTHLGWSSCRIGRLLGRDHSTVLVGIHQTLATLRTLGLCPRCAGRGATASAPSEPCELCDATGNAPTTQERRTA